MSNNRKMIYADDLVVAIRDDYSINSTAFAAIVRHINAAPAVRINPAEVVPGISKEASVALDRMGAQAHGAETTELLYGSSPCECLPRRKEPKE